MKKTPKLLKHKRRLRRKLHSRKTLRGNALKPRMSVTRSLDNMFVQFIDDEAGRTLLGLGTLSKSFRDGYTGNRGNVLAASALGERLAGMAKGVGINSIVFDRNGLRFHGRVKALAEALRKGGIKF